VAVRAFACEVCGQLLFFENSVCLRCSTPQGFVPEQLALTPLREDGELVRCAQAELAACNWLVEREGGEPFCASCRLTRTRPNDNDIAGLAAYVEAERAKRRLLFELLDLGLEIDRPDLRFDLLSSAFDTVMTGHDDGLITLDLAESDDAQREARRTQLDEPYRTVLGHFRHEIGHYYWPALVQAAGAEELERWRELFGDERTSYDDALKRHYESGPPADWRERYVSAYATMHPWEDWAESFSHYLHIHDTLQTAADFGLVVLGPQAASDAALSVAATDELLDGPFNTIIAAWLPLTYALNAVNRSMGKEDLYPFTLAPTVIDKLAYVHERVGAAAPARTTAPAP
jgi:hypothetical protein